MSTVLKPEASSQNRSRMSLLPAPAKAKLFSQSAKNYDWTEIQPLRTQNQQILTWIAQQHHLDQVVATALFYTGCSFLGLHDDAIEAASCSGAALGLQNDEVTRGLCRQRAAALRDAMYAKRLWSDAEERCCFLCCP